MGYLPAGALEHDAAPGAACDGLSDAAAVQNTTDFSDCLKRGSVQVQPMHCQIVPFVLQGLQLPFVLQGLKGIHKLSSQ